MQGKPSKIIRKQLCQMEEKSLTPKDLINTRKIILYHRRKSFPTNPKDRSEVHKYLRDTEILTNKGEKFIHVNNEDDGIVIITCETNLKCLCSVATDVFADGTFKMSPQFFNQFYTIHGFQNGQYVPLIYCLLTKNDETTYNMLWMCIRELCEKYEQTFNPPTIHVDFEGAMLSSIKIQFPDAKVVCCQFHLGQSWYRKIHKLGLSEDYRSKESANRYWFKKVFGLAFLNPNEVSWAFVEEIMSDKPEGEAYTQFTDYLTDTYISEVARFPPILWAMDPLQSEKRTNNAAEAFHRHYNAEFYSNHPSVYRFLDVVLQIQAENYIKIRAMDSSNDELPSGQSTNMLKESYEKYVSGEVSRENYLKVAGFRHSPDEAINFTPEL